MSRFSTFVAAVQAAYPSAGGEEWMVGATNLFASRNWNRIVAFAAAGSIGPPDMASPDRTDEYVMLRKLRAGFSIWASTYEQAENRLHALLLAIDTVAGSHDGAVGNFEEVWIREQSGDVTGGGAQVLLTFDLGLRVLASDRAVVVSGALPGAGTPTTPIGPITILTDPDAGTVVIPP